MHRFAAMSITLVLLITVVFLSVLPMQADGTRPGVPLTPEEERLLSAVIARCAETVSLPFPAQVAIAAVVLRRLEHGAYGATLAQVLAGAGLLAACDLTAPDTALPETVRRMVRHAVQAAENGADPTGGAWAVRLRGTDDASPRAAHGEVLFSCGDAVFYGADF